MATRKPRETVVVTHPTGRFTVHVSPARAEKLLGRGYRVPAAAPPAARNVTAPDQPSTRAELNARAKALGIPAKGTNEALRSAIAAAEEG